VSIINSSTKQKPCAFKYLLNAASKHPFHSSDFSFKCLILTAKSIFWPQGFSYVKPAQPPRVPGG